MVSQKHGQLFRTMYSSLLYLTVLACSGILSECFSPMLSHPRMSTTPSSRPSTALNVWWFGGTEPTETTQGDSCELVAVRIERTSPNSRRIAGEITVDAPLQDVWAILTDYDQLSAHVPNLIESKTLPTSTPQKGEPGDGQYKCRLYQKGAQKIVGFDFSASVTMDMTEKILAAGEEGVVPQSRMIGFKCVDSFFFSEFDGMWKVEERLNPLGKMESVVSYTVDVRPKGPVPVAALEWRIREDVPTNLRAVKHAALTVGYDGVMAERRFASPATARYQRRLSADSGTPGSSNKRQPIAQPKPGVRQPFVTARLATYPGSDWGEDETMAAYLEKDS